mmetsp:Transcript_12468/g.39862  ORF Transcript_12468/g.39862 Transcript_12468/m.39862 type:complete len:321 (-) Transcript_12468:69-1031(-)
MPSPVQHFRRKVLGRATERSGPMVYLRDALLAESKVGQLDVSIGVQQDILRLEIAVHDVALVHVVQSKHQLCRVEAGAGLGEAALTAQVEEELPTCAIVDHEEELLLVLESETQRHQERVVQLAQHRPLRHGVLQLVPAKHRVLSQHLHGVQLARRPLPHQKHLAEAALANHTNQREVIHPRPRGAPSRLAFPPTVGLGLRMRRRIPRLAVRLTRRRYHRDANTRWGDVCFGLEKMLKLGHGAHHGYHEQLLDPTLQCATPLLKKLGRASPKHAFGRTGRCLRHAAPNHVIQGNKTGETPEDLPRNSALLDVNDVHHVFL